MKPSSDQYTAIYGAWLCQEQPLHVAKVLRLHPLTVIKEYLRLDEGHCQ